MLLDGRIIATVVMVLFFHSEIQDYGAAGHQDHQAAQQADGEGHTACQLQGLGAAYSDHGAAFRHLRYQ